jgi:exosortase/archaeosortase family protein
MKKETILRLSIIIFLILLLINFYPEYDLLTNITVKLLAIVSSLYFGFIPIYSKNTIFYNFESITPIVVSPECSGLFVIFVFLFVVWLVPNVSIKNRLYAFGLVPILFFGNILRLFIAIVVGDKFNTDALQIYHGTIGQLFIFIILISCFIMFTNFNKNINEVNIK